MDVISAPMGSVWFMSRYHNLTTLEKLLAQDPDRHVLGEAHAQFIIAGVFIGVDFLHTRDIVHGNIRPSKVLINDLGYPVLVRRVRSLMHVVSLALMLIRPYKCVHVWRNLRSVFICVVVYNIVTFEVKNLIGKLLPCSAMKRCWSGLHIYIYM